MIKMRAAVLRSAEPMKIEEVELDGPRDGEVVIKLSACGVCHSDFHGIERARTTGIRVPTILGHEAAGIVEAVGAGVRSVEVGDPVVAAFHARCGRCYFCLRGQPQLCERPDSRDRSVMGKNPRLRAGGAPVYQGIGIGGFAEYVCVPEGGVVKVRDDAPLRTVCLVGCGVTTGVGAVANTARVEVGSNVAVIGLGGVGLNVVQGARLVGARRVIAVDVLESKLDLAKQFGATHCVLGGAEDTIEKVRAAADGYLDYAFEAIGLPQTVADALAMVRPGGTAVSVGVVYGPIQIPGNELLREKRLIGSFYGSASVQYTIPNLIDLYMGGQLKIDELVSKRRPLEEINEAFADLEAGEVARTVIDYSL